MRWWCQVYGTGLTQHPIKAWFINIKTAQTWPSNTPQPLERWCASLPEVILINFPLFQNYSYLREDSSLGGCFCSNFWIMLHHCWFSLTFQCRFVIMANNCKRNGMISLHARYHYSEVSRDRHPMKSFLLENVIEFFNFPRKRDCVIYCTDM